MKCGVGIYSRLPHDISIVLDHYFSFSCCVYCKMRLYQYLIMINSRHSSFPYPSFSFLLYFTPLHSTSFTYPTFLYSSLLLYPLHPILFFFVTLLNQLCQSQKKADLECYYEPLSRCSIKDALLGSDNEEMLSLEDITHVGDVLRGDEAKMKEKYKSKKYNIFYDFYKIVIRKLIFFHFIFRFSYFCFVPLCLFYFLFNVCLLLLVIEFLLLF